MRDYTNYIESLENADIRYTDEEWLKIINREARDIEDTQAVKIFII